MKGWEILKNISEGKIKDGTKFLIKIGNNFEGNELIYKNEDFKSTLYNCDILNRYLKDNDYDFEIIEDKIDIQNIEDPINFKLDQTDEILIEFYSKIKELIKAVKQLDKRIS